MELMDDMGCQEGLPFKRDRRLFTATQRLLQLAESQ